MSRVRITNNQPIVRPLARQPKWPYLSAPAVTTFRDNEVYPRLDQMGVSRTGSDYDRMRAITQGGATMWWRHPAAYSALRYRAGGDSIFAPDDFNPVTMWSFVKAGGSRTGTVNDAGTISTGTFSFTGLKGDFTGPVDNNKSPTECTQQHLLTYGFAAALGIQSRLMNIGWLSGGNPVGHVPYEYWDRQLRKWVIVDSTYGILGMRRSGVLLGWAEVHRLAVAGRASEIAVELIPGYNSANNPDLVFNPAKITALAVKWYMAHFGVGQSVGLPKDSSVILMQSGDYTVMRGSNWPESPSLREAEYPFYALEVVRATVDSVGVNVRLANTVPNFVRYEWQAAGGSTWTAITGDSVNVPSGARIRAIDDVENSSNVVTVEVV